MVEVTSEVEDKLGQIDAEMSIGIAEAETGTGIGWEEIEGIGIDVLGSSVTSELESALDGWTEVLGRGTVGNDDATIDVVAGDPVVGAAEGMTVDEAG